MGSRYTWKKLLSPNRERQSGNASKGQDIRNEFEKDYDRMICSSAVRRLQNKTQVFPLQEDDVVRTRLTHSLEVSSIARSMGYAIGQLLLKNCKEKVTKDEGDENIAINLANILATAGLVHDLGNPPFGHYGETVIREWFQKKRGELCGITEIEEKDFELFEGNAQSLRIVSKLQNLNDYNGLNFTYATLASIIKYPWSSTHIPDKEKKYGYFRAEDELIKHVYEETGTGMDKYKNPLAYILEAADDITYLLDDIEDGVRKGLIPWEKEQKDLIKQLKNIDSDGVTWLEDKDEKLKDRYEDDEWINISAQNFRVKIQGNMILSANRTFIEKYDEIMNNSLDGDLISNSDYGEYTNILRDITKKYCFRTNEVLKLELAGDKIMNGLLDYCWEAIDTNATNTDGNMKSKNEKIYSLISKNFKDVYSKSPKTTYHKLLLLTDYVSGMTDSYALKLYKELMGYRLP